MITNALERARMKVNEMIYALPDDKRIKIGSGSGFFFVGTVGEYKDNEGLLDLKCKEFLNNRIISLKDRTRLSMRSTRLNAEKLEFVKYCIANDITVDDLDHYKELAKKDKYNDAYKELIGKIEDVFKVDDYKDMTIELIEYYEGMIEHVAEAIASESYIDMIQGQLDEVDKVGKFANNVKNYNAAISDKRSYLPPSDRPVKESFEADRLIDNALIIMVPGCELGKYWTFDERGEDGPIGL